MQIIRTLDVKTHTNFQPNISILAGRTEFLKFEARDLILGQWAIFKIKNNKNKKTSRVHWNE